MLKYKPHRGIKYHKQIIHCPGIIIYLEVIKRTLGNVIIKLLHWVPWSITHPNQNNWERIVAVSKKDTDQYSNIITILHQDYKWNCFT